MPRPSQVALSLYSVRGRLVRRLVNGYREAGTYAVRIDASGLASGIYICRLEAGPHVQSRRLVLLR